MKRPPRSPGRPTHRRLPLAPAATPAPTPAPSPTATLSRLHGRWVDELVGGPIPRESLATCEDCVMCRPPERGGPGDAPAWSPSLKCCSFQPDVPNFLVGGVLRDAAAGSAVVLQRLATGAGVTPFGLEPLPSYRAVYGTMAETAFGRAEALRCMYFDVADGGRCQIWAHRNGVCATYFCRHVRAAVGRAFWRTVRDLLTAVEVELARWCLLELELDPGALAPYWNTPTALATDAPGRAIDEHSLALRAHPGSVRVWGPWWGQAEKLFIRCAELVEPLGFADVVARCGPTVALRARIARQAYARLCDPGVPPRLMLAQFTVVAGRESGECVLMTHGNLEAVRAPVALLSALPYFTGAATTDAVDRVRAELDLELDADTLLRLYDHGVLVAVE